MAQQGLERIPYAVGPDFNLDPVRANFPERSETGPTLISFEPDQVAQEPSIKAPKMGGIDTLSLIGRNVWDAVVYHTPAAIAAAIEGDEPYKTTDWKDSLIERSRRRSQEAAGGAPDAPSAIPGVSRTDINSLGPSLGFSAVGAGAGLGAGVPAAIAGNVVAPGVGTVAGYGAGMLASGKAAFNMATNSFVRDLHDAANEESLKATGKPIKPEDFAAKQSALSDVIRSYGLWEAVPEAAGNALSFGILTAPVKGAIGKLFGSNIATRLASKMGALYGEELATETVTQTGQHNAEVAAGLTKAPERSFTSPQDLADSFKEVAPSTILQTTLMAGGFKAGQKGIERLRGRKAGESGDNDNAPASNSPQPVEGTFIPADRSGPPSAAPGAGGDTFTQDREPPQFARPALPAPSPLEGDILGPQALPAGQAMLPPGAIDGTATEIGDYAPAPTLRQQATSRGLLNHSSRPSPDTLKRLMRIDDAMAKRLYDAWAAAQTGPQQISPTDGGQDGQRQETAQVLSGAGEQSPAITPLEVQAHAAATSPYNARPQPTDAQKKAGNYAKGHIRFHGMDISIENPAGSVRAGTDEDGKAWETMMQHHYGYIKGTVGRDKDHLDVFIKPGAQSARTAYVIDQTNPKTGAFDEHKIVLGADSEQDARSIYQANYQPGWNGLGAITAMPIDGFKAWIDSGKTTRPLAYKEPKGTPKHAPSPAAANHGPISYGKVGPAPGAARPISLQDNGDGMATVMAGGEPFYDFDSGDPVRVPAGARPTAVKQAIIDAGAVTSRDRWFSVNDGDGKTDHDRGMEKLAADWAEQDREEAKKLTNPAPEVDKAKPADDLSAMFDDVLAEEIKHKSPQEKTPQTGHKSGLNLTPTKNPPAASEAPGKAVAQQPVQPAVSVEQNAKSETQAALPSTGDTQDRAKDAKGNPIYRTGDRVEYVSGQYEGRHGAVSQVTPMTTTVLGLARDTGYYAQNKSTSYYYHVKTDNGSDFMASAEEIRFETEKPEKVIPDIEVDGMIQEPRRVFDGIAYAKRSAANSRAAAQRARKAQMISEHKRNAQTQDEKAARYQAAWDAWAKQYPEEAEKIAPKKPEPAPAAATGEAPATGSAIDTAGILKAAGLNVLKTTTNNGTPVWNVSGNTKEHSEAIKAIGGRWYGPKKVWSFYNDDPSAEIAKKLSGKVKPAAPAVLADNEVQLPNSPYIYRKESNGWTWRVAGSDPLRANALKADAPIIAEQLDPAFKAKTTIAGKPTIEMPDATLERLSESPVASPVAKEKAKVELEKRDEADKPDMGAMFDEVLADEVSKGQHDELDAEMRDYERRAENPHGGTRFFVGDRVLADDGRRANMRGSVIAIDGNTALVRLDGGGEFYYQTENMTLLQRGSVANAQSGAETVSSGPYASWRDSSPKERRELLRIAGYTDEDQARTLSGIEWNQLTDTVRRALSGSRTAGQAAASAAKNTAAGLADAIDGLGALFGSNGSRLSSGLTFDEETYKKAKPLFAQAIAHFKDAGADLKEAMRAVVRLVLDKFGPQVAENMKPYVVRFMEDVRDGKVVYDETKEGAGNERSGDGQQGKEALAPVVAGKDGGPEGGGGVRVRNPGRGETGATGNRKPEGTGIPSARSGRGSPSSVHSAQAGTGDRVEPTNVPAINFEITDDVQLGKGGEAVKFADNIAAIETLKAIERERRRATPEEQRTLARYVGWGGLSNAFADPTTGEFKEKWQERGQRLAELLTPAELKAARRSTRNAHYTSETIVRGMWDIARRLGFSSGMVLEPSSGTGNFFGLAPKDITPRFIGVEFDSLTARIAQALYPQATILHSGFQKVALPDDTFDLAIGNPPFGSESLRFQFKPELNGASIHNQFFRASMDAVKPGGLQIMVVSRYLMDAQDSTTRAALARSAELVGAIRLPDTAFQENARTEVVTDILILRKLTRAEQADMDAAFAAARSRPERTADKERERLALAAKIPDWINTTEIKDPLGGDPMRVNSYFAEHGEMILGTLERSGSMRYENDITVRLDKGSDLGALMQEAISRLPADIIDNSDTPLASIEKRFKDLSDALRIALEGHEPGSIVFEKDGSLIEVVERETSGGAFELMKRPLTAESPWSSRLSIDSEGNWYEVVVVMDDDGKPVKRKGENGKPTKFNLTEKVVYGAAENVPSSLRLGDAKFERLVKLVQLRDLLKEQLSLEAEDAETGPMEANRRELNSAYDGFVAAHGYISEDKNAALVSEMPDGALVMALEMSFRPEITPAKAKRMGDAPRKAEATKAAILSQRVVVPYLPPNKAASPADALVISLSESGGVDLVRIAGLLNTDEEGAIKALHTDQDNPLIFRDPESNQWETRDKYLSGQVKRKLTAARAANLDRNVRALEAVQPAPWGADQVTAILGSTWIPTSVYEDFINHLTGEPGRVRFLSATNSFDVMAPDTAKGAEWKTEDAKLTYLLQQTMNSAPIRLTWTDSDGKTHFMQEESALAAMKAKQIGDEFQDWVFADGKRRGELVAIFNEKFNTRVTRQHDGSHLILPGKVPDMVISLRRHQKNAVWRGISERFMLLDHVVGAGKTFTAIARAMERRRMGLSKKPAIIVPNHMVEQFTIDIYRLYPGAKVLAAGKKDFEKKNRRRLFAKIATGDWDIVVIPHSSFKFISISPEAEERYLDGELEKAREAVKEAEEQAEEDGHTGWRKPFNVKQAELLVEKLEARRDKLKHDTADRLLTFEQLGIDDLTVDEAHEFKNLYYSSRATDIRGMGNKTGSEKAYDLYQKVRLLRESPTGTVTFMTGTPISNSAVEMYTVLRYLAADELDDLGLDHFDSWRAQYVDASEAWEPTESGGLKQVKRLGRTWSNMRSLMELYYSVTDAVSLDDIKKWYAEDKGGKAFPVPGVKGGERTRVIVQPTEATKLALKDIIAGFDGLESIEDVKERNAERLRLMDRARKVSVDVRCLNRGYTEPEKGGKVWRVAQEAKRIYDQWTPERGTQLIFLDRSVPKAKGDDKKIKDYDKVVALRDQALRNGDEVAYRDAVERLDAFDANEIKELRAAQSGGWNAYQQIKDNLVELGVPAKEIRFVQEANTDEQKQALFDAVNAGEVRILIGSTPRMGAGTNVQRRLVALHHVDVTWKPSDIEQREGRIIRQGNRIGFDENDNPIRPGFEVEILAYATERTMDAKMWDLNATKLRTINGIRKYGGEFTMEFEDEDAVGMAELAALASGDPLLIERVKLQGDIDRLDMLRRAWNRKVMAAKDRVDEAERKIATLPGTIERKTNQASMLTSELRKVEDEANARRATVEGKEYRSEMAAHAAALETIDKQRDGKENARFSIDVNGERITSKDALDDALGAAFGDSSPFVMTIDGSRFIQRTKAAAVLTDKINQMLKELSDTRKTISARVGEFLGKALEIDVSEGRWSSAVFDYSLSLVDADGRSIVSIQDFINKEKKGSFANAASLRAFLRKMDEEIAYRASGQSISWDKSNLSQAQKDLSTLREQADIGPFPQADEMAEKTRRLEDVVRQLAGKTQTDNHSPAAADAAESRAIAGMLRGNGSAVIREAMDIVGRFVKEFKRAADLDIRVVASPDEIPERYRPSRYAEGVYHSDIGTVWIVTGNLMRGPRLNTVRTFQVLLHEAVGHYGMSVMLGERFPSLKRRVLEKAKAKGRVFDDTYRPGDADYATVEAVRLRYPGATEDQVADEVLARMAETNPGGTLFGYVRAVVRQWLRDMARKMGIQWETTTAELNDLVALASGYMRRGAGVAGDRAPSGVAAASKSVQKQYRSVDTNSPEFKAWFGNSKVVDAEGKPMVVYHGTTRWEKEDGRQLGDVEAFDRMASVNIVGRGHSIDTVGSWFSTNPGPNGAGMYGDTMYPVYLSIKNPHETTFQLMSRRARLLASGVDDGRKIGKVEVDAYRKWLSDMGKDGIHIVHDQGAPNGSTEFKNQDAWIALEPTQIKSAISNTGEFSDSPSIFESRARPGADEAIWDAPDPTTADNVIYTLQDKHIDLKRVQAAIKDAIGQELPDQIDPYLQEELFHGRAAKATEEFLDRELQPLIGEMKQRGIGMDSLETYLWARHASERNAQIAKINPDMPDGGSGLTDKQARDVLAGKDVVVGGQTVKGIDPAKLRGHAEIARKVDMMVAGNRLLLELYELETPSTLAAWKGAYQHYVPLHREDVDSPWAGQGTGQGYSVRGSSSKRATGSYRPVENILANLVMQRKRIITRGEKNRVAQALYGLATVMENRNFWTIDDVPKTRVPREMAIYHVMDGDTEVANYTRMSEADKHAAKIPGGYVYQSWGERVVEQDDPLFRSRPNVVWARFGGEDRFVIFNERDERAMRLAGALKNLDADDISHFLGEVSRWTRYFASINTQYNPVFGIVNLARDTGTGLLNLKNTPLEGRQAELLGHVWQALPAIYRAIRIDRKGGTPAGAWAELWEEFQEAGGQTGYRDMFRNATEQRDALEAALDSNWWQRKTWGKVISAGGLLAPAEQALLEKAGKPILDWLSDYNTTMENAIRLSAYKVARDHGMSRERAASLAKNLTVNFNRKGQSARQLGALYAFFNASVQGTARMLDTLTHGRTPGHLLGRAGKQIVYGGLLLGAMQAMWLAAAGFDDDEPPEFVRDKAIIIPLPDKRYLSVPLPLGFHVLPALGRIATEQVLNGFKSPGRAAFHALDVMADAFNPVGNSGMSMQTLAPTVLDPAAALAENKDWTGKPIYRENMSALDPKPGHQRTKDTATALSKWLSQALNSLTGGTEFTPGGLSPTPDQIDYLIGQVTGGVGREVSKLAQTAGAMATGEELPAHKIPLLGRFYGDAKGQASVSSKFYENLKAMNIHQAEVMGLAKSDRGEQAKAYLEGHPEASMFREADRVQRYVGKLQDEKRKAIADRVPSAKVKEIDAKITEAMQGFNARVASRRAPAVPVQ